MRFRPRADANLLAVWGSPIAHSRSPILHDAAAEVLGNGWHYGRVEVDEAGFDTALDALDEHWRGLSLTMPLKRRAAERAGVLDDAARLTGAVNTLVFGADGDTHFGGNTDVAGIVGACRLAGIPGAEHLVLLGGGATAASALVAGVRLGARTARVHLRDPRKAEELQPLAAALGVHLDAAPLAGGLALPRGSLLISTLPGPAQAAVPLSEDALADAYVMDVAYDPWPSRIARAAHAVGAPLANGLAMLALQAVEQQALFRTGSSDGLGAERAAVTRAMLHSVGLDERGAIATPR